MKRLLIDVGGVVVPAPTLGAMWSKFWASVVASARALWGVVEALREDPTGWVRELRWRVVYIARLATAAVFPLLVLVLLNVVMLGTDQGTDLLRGLRDSQRGQVWFFACAAYLGLACGLAAWVAVNVESKYADAEQLSDERKAFRELLRNSLVLVAVLFALVPTWLAWFDETWAFAAIVGALIALAINVLLFGYLPEASTGSRPLSALSDLLSSPAGQPLVNVLMLAAFGVFSLGAIVATSLTYAGIAALAIVVTLWLFGRGGFADWFRRRRLHPVGGPQWWVLALLLTGGCGFFLVSAGWAETLGAPGIIMLAFGFWALVLTLVLAVPARTALAALLGVVALAGVMQLWPLWSREPHRVPLVKPATPADTEGLQRVATSRADFDRHVQAWLAQRKIGANERYPVYFVAAEGGGIRAAYWTALVLSRLHVATGGAFSDQAFAISAVSGGSVGAAAFVAALAERRAADAPCARREIAFSADDRARLLRLLERDHLAPIAGAMVYGDALRLALPWFWVGSDRAYHFERSLAAAYAAEFAGSTRLDQPFTSLWAGDVACLSLPSLLLNATDVASGKRVVFTDLTGLAGKLRDATVLALPAPAALAPCAPGQAHDPSRIADVALKSAAHMSARFPYVSPAGTLVTTECDAPSGQREVRRQLVDGGYFDNSGAASLRELMSAFSDAAANANCGGARCAERIDLRVILIENDPAAPIYRGLDHPQREAQAGPIATALTCDGRSAELARAPDGNVRSQLTVPLSAFWNARSARGSLAKDELGEFVRRSHAAQRARCEQAAGGEAGRRECAGAPSILSFSIAEQACASKGAGVEAVTPPLGWVLSRGSQQSMRDYACAKKGWFEYLRLRNGASAPAEIARLDEAMCPTPVRQ